MCYLFVFHISAIIKMRNTTKFIIGSRISVPRSHFDSGRSSNATFSQIISPDVVRLVGTIDRLYKHQKRNKMGLIGVYLGITGLIRVDLGLIGSHRGWFWTHRNSSSGLIAHHTKYLHPLLINFKVAQTLVLKIISTDLQSGINPDQSHSVPFSPVQSRYPVLSWINLYQSRY